MMTFSEDTMPRMRRGKPAMGRPLLFALLLTLASLGMLTLLVAGPAIPLQLAIASAGGLIVMVAITWVVAGPRL